MGGGGQQHSSSSIVGRSGEHTEVLGSSPMFISFSITARSPLAAALQSCEMMSVTFILARAPTDSKYVTTCQIKDNPRVRCA
jgi:hypothetical protein